MPSGRSLRGGFRVTELTQGIAKQSRGGGSRTAICRTPALEPPRRFAPPLLTQEGSRLHRIILGFTANREVSDPRDCKAIPRGVVPKPQFAGFWLWNHPGAPSLDVPPLLTQEGSCSTANREVSSLPAKSVRRSKPDPTQSAHRLLSRRESPAAYSARRPQSIRPCRNPGRSMSF